MLINDILPSDSSHHLGEIRRVIHSECSQFITESKGVPLVKSLDSQIGLFKRVKVRQRNRNNPIGSIFEEATNVFAIRERSLIANGLASDIVEEDCSEYFVFPLDGYSYIYSKDIQNSAEVYSRALENLKEAVGTGAGEIAADLVKMSYKTGNLSEALKTGCEILIYDTPAFYAVSAEAFPNYTSIIIQ
jgi:hypothetical protein